MKKFLSSLIITAAFLPCVGVAAPYHSLGYYDSITNTTNRVIDRSLEPEVRRVHTGIDPAAGGGIIFYKSSYEANMCVLELKHCKNARSTDGLSVSDCFQFTPTIKCTGNNR